MVASISPTPAGSAGEDQTVHAFLAFRATLLAVREHNRSAQTPIESLLCPGLGTAVGRMPASRCAYQMHTALLAVAGEIPTDLLLGQARELHISMLTA